VYGALVAVPDTLLRAFRPRTSPQSVASVLRSVLWPIAIVSVIHRSYVLGTNGYITDDFGPVYRAVINFKRGLDIYNEHFDQVDPHYLYPPGGTLLLAPFGYLPVTAARYWFITFNTIAVILAAYFLLRLFNYTLSSVAAPALLLAMFCTESVTNTLVFTNINGCILFCEVLFFRWLLDGKVNHQWLAGVAVGLTLVIKPSLAPLLLLPLLNRQWRALIPAVGVPLLFNAVAWPLVSDPMSFVRRTVPYIFSTRDYFNSSIQGNGIYYGLPLWLILVLRIVFGLLAVGSLWLLYRYYRERDPLFWMLTSSGVLLVASFLVLSLGQAYYSMMLFPFLMTVVLPNSVLRNWVAWLAIYGFMTMDRWLLIYWVSTGRYLEYMKITYGWSLMLIVVFCVLYFRYLDAKADDRLSDGIDPPWMTKVEERASVEA
jgi:arabinofuranan 3-O-arabinosyltransferase